MIASEADFEREWKKIEADNKAGIIEWSMCRIENDRCVFDGRYFFQEDEVSDLTPELYMVELRKSLNCRWACLYWNGVVDKVWRDGDVIKIRLRELW